MNPVVLGIDIGGTNIAFGLCSKDGYIVSENQIRTRSVASPEDLVDKLYEIYGGQFDSIQAIGIGAPNGNYHSGCIEFAPNLNWRGKIQLKTLFEKSFNIPTTLTNDANAAAQGEMMFGAAQDLQDFVTITLGTGVGSGIVINGQVVYGHDGFAGEFGHIRVEPNGRDCGCGRKGCLETYVSATGVIRSIKELPSENKVSSALIKLENPTAKDVFDLSREGDKFAEEIVAFTINRLGAALADFACFSSPKAYVLFGGVARNGSGFDQKVKEAMEQELLKIYQNKIEVRLSQLLGSDAAILGAASLAWSSIKD